MQRGVQVTQAFRNEIGKAVKTKRLTTGRTQKAFALEVGTTATTLETSRWVCLWYHRLY